MEVSEGETIVDTSVLVGFFNEADSLHKKAVEAMFSTSRPVIVHEYVFLETATVLMNRTNKKTADDFIFYMLTNADIKIMHGSEPIFLLAVKCFTENKTKQLSFTDAALLALSKTYSILTFDESLNRAIKKQKEMV